MSEIGSRTYRNVVVIWRKVVVTLLRLAAVLTVLAAVAPAAGAGEPLKVHVGIRAEFAVAGAGSVWTTNSIERRLVRIDPATNRVSARIALKGDYPLGISYGAGSIWVANRYSGSVTRVSTATNKAARSDQGRLRALRDRVWGEKHLGLERVERERSAGSTRPETA